MIPRTICPAIAVGILLHPGAVPSGARLMSTCGEQPPPQWGEFGRGTIQRKVLPESLREPLFWHIDRFESGDATRAAVGGASVAFGDAGTWWLMTIESQPWDHRGGEHVAAVGPLALPPAPRHTLQVQSSVFGPGPYSLVHPHSGVEAVHVVDGEACFETPTRAVRLQRGDALPIGAGTSMRAVVAGSVARHLFAVIVHDSAQPATMRMEEGTGPKLVARV